MSFQKDFFGNLVFEKTWNVFAFIALLSSADSDGCHCFSSFYFVLIIMTSFYQLYTDWFNISDIINVEMTFFCTNSNQIKQNPDFECKFIGNEFYLWNIA